MLDILFLCVGLLTLILCGAYALGLERLQEPGR